MNLRETCLDSKTVFRGRIVNVRDDRVSLPDGREARREVIEHPGGVAVVALTDNCEVLIVRQFRYPHMEIMCEIPAGKLEPGEDPAECGRRELREETGFVCEHFEPLGTLYPSPGCYAEILYLFLARTLTFAGQNLDDEEFLTVEMCPMETLIDRVMSNEIKDAKTIAGLMMARERIRMEGGTVSCQK